MKTIGKRLARNSYRKEFYRQGYIYKNFQNFERKRGVCYVPELSDKEYTYDDFLALCGGNHTLAEFVFEIVDWQHPETVVEENDFS